MTSPASSGPAGPHFEAQIGAYYLLAMLSQSDPRGLPGFEIERVEFQRAEEGFPLDDVIVHGRDNLGGDAVLQVQVKRSLRLTASDENFRKVVGQILSATSTPGFWTSRNELAVAVAKGSFHWDSDVQEVLRWARVGTCELFTKRLNRAGVANTPMRRFVDNFRSQLRDLGARFDDESVWGLLTRLQILVFDFPSVGSVALELAHERARHLLALGQEDAKKLWSTLVDVALDNSRIAGELTTQTLRRHLVDCGYEIENGSRGGKFERLQSSIDNIPDAIFAVLESRGIISRASNHGLERQAIFAIAEKLRPNEMLDISQAINEIEAAVTVALEVISKKGRVSSPNGLVDQVLAQVEEKTKAGSFDEASQAVDVGLSVFDARESEIVSEINRQRVTLLEAGLKQDILRRDPTSAATRIEQIAKFSEQSDRPAWTHTFMSRLYQLKDDSITTGATFLLRTALLLIEKMKTAAASDFEVAIAQAERGSIGVLMGEREAGTDTLEQSAVLLRSALSTLLKSGKSEWSDEASMNLARAVRFIGDRTKDQELAEEAVALFRDTISSIDRGANPDRWVRAAMGLAGALRELGKFQTKGTDPLSEAVELYRDIEAATSMDADHVWLGVLNNFGIALRAFGENTGDLSTINEAISVHRKAVGRTDGETAPHAAAAASTNLGLALLAKWEGAEDPNLLTEALSAHEAALQRTLKQERPSDWAIIQNNRGNALRRLKRYDEAIEAHEKAIAVFADSQSRIQWALTALVLGEAQFLSGMAKADSRLISQAEVSLRGAIGKFSREDGPTQWMRMNENLCRILLLAEPTLHGASKVREAIAINEALLRDKFLGRDADWAIRAQGNLGLAQLRLAMIKSDFRMAKSARRTLEAVLALKPEELTNKTSDYAGFLETAKNLVLTLKAHR